MLISKGYLHTSTRLVTTACSTYKSPHLIKIKSTVRLIFDMKVRPGYVEGTLGRDPCRANFRHVNVSAIIKRRLMSLDTKGDLVSG